MPRIECNAQIIGVLTHESQVASLLDQNNSDQRPNDRTAVHRLSKSGRTFDKGKNSNQSNGQEEHRREADIDSNAVQSWNFSQ